MSSAAYTRAADVGEDTRPWPGHRCSLHVCARSLCRCWVPRNLSMQLGKSHVSLRAVVLQAAVKQWIADYRSRSDNAAADATPPALAPSESDMAANKAAVDSWIAAWFSKVPEEPPAPDTADVSARQEEVASWIAAWQAKVPEPVQAIVEAVEDAAADVQQRQADVQAWIDAWQTKPAPTNGSKSSNGASQQDDVEAWIAQWRAKSAAGN